MSRLKELRRERGYTQIKMQHLTGIDQSDYSKIEMVNATILSSNAAGLLWLLIQVWIIWPGLRMLRMLTRGNLRTLPRGLHQQIKIHKSMLTVSKEPMNVFIIHS